MNINQKPGKVSPLIKGFRWSLLLAGVIFGIRKKGMYEIIDKKESIIIAKQIEERKRREAIVNKKAYKELVKELAEIFQVQLPPGWEPPY